MKIHLILNVEIWNALKDGSSEVVKTFTSYEEAEQWITDNNYELGDVDFNEDKIKEDKMKNYINSIQTSIYSGFILKALNLSDDGLSFKDLVLKIKELEQIEFSESFSEGRLSALILTQIDNLKRNGRVMNHPTRMGPRGGTVLVITEKGKQSVVLYKNKNQGR